MDGGAIETVKEFGVPGWVIALAISAAALFFIYRSVRETQLIDLQILKLKKETGNA